MMPKIMLLRLEGRFFALGLDSVWYILQTPRTFPVAGAKAELRGVFLHRGELVPLLEPGAVVEGGAEDVPEVRPGSSPFTVVYGTDLGPVGVPADQVLQIVDRDQGTLRTPAGSPTAPDGSCFIFGAQEFPVLDVESLIHGIAPLADGPLPGAKEA